MGQERGEEPWSEEWVGAEASSERSSWRGETKTESCRTGRGRSSWEQRGEEELLGWDEVLGSEQPGGLGTHGGDTRSGAGEVAAALTGSPE